MSTPNVIGTSVGGVSLPSPFYPPNPEFSDQAFQCLNAEFPALVANVGNLIHLQYSAAEAAAASTTAIHAAAATATTEQTVTTGITQPSCPRNLVVTFGGTATDLAAVATVISGKDFNGNSISESFMATLNTGSTVTGTKIFAAVDQYVNGAHDGTGATIAIGTGSKLGIPYKLRRNTVLAAYLNNVKEGTAPTVNADSDELEKNHFTLNSALDGTAVDLYLMHSGI